MHYNKIYILKLILNFSLVITLYLFNLQVLPIYNFILLYVTYVDLLLATY